jgi:enoyl-CoA hydratase/carnithine racemase
MNPISENKRILIEIINGVGRFTINNANKRNAMSKSMWQEMGDIFENWAINPEVRVVVICGAGSKCFCAGNDISEFSVVRNTKADITAYNQVTERAYKALKNMPKPTIALIKGYCIGGGLELALLCDLQFAASTATFGITPAKLGLGYKLEDILLLIENISMKSAKELLFTGRKFSADDAMRWGLINRIAEPENLVATVNTYVDEIVANAPLSIKAAKLIIQEAAKTDGNHNTQLCQTLVDACHESHDYQEGQEAFSEKRKPIFNGN